MDANGRKEHIKAFQTVLNHTTKSTESLLRATISLLHVSLDTSLSNLTEAEAESLFESLLEARGRTQIPPKDIGPILTKLWTVAEKKK